jgi:cytochrome c-type biogenesis protein CcmF
MGGVFMAVGGLLGALDRRYRLMNKKAVPADV